MGANLLLFYILSSQISDILSFYHEIKADWTYLCNTMDEIIQCIDAGNTAIKIGVFKQNELQEIQRFDSFESLNSNLDPSYPVALASVKQEDYFEFLENKYTVYKISSNSQTPFINHYHKNLGADRMCNAAAINAFVTKQKRKGGGLAIDIGTCIKFDYVDPQSNYLGGSISPGIALQLKSLHDYTARLPLLPHPKDSIKLFGDSTETSIYAGVMGGIKGEIIWRINEFRKLNPKIAIFITGGDAHHFDLAQKNGIFADENLTLIGIHEIYKFNASPS